MPRLKQTRLKLVVCTVLLFFIEAFAKHFFKEIPIGELYTAQGALVIAYITGKSYGKKFERNNEH